MDRFKEITWLTQIVKLSWILASTHCILCRACKQQRTEVQNIKSGHLAVQEVRWIKVIYSKERIVLLVIEEPRRGMCLILHSLLLADWEVPAMKDFQPLSNQTCKLHVRDHTANIVSSVLVHYMKNHERDEETWYDEEFLWGIHEYSWQLLI